MRSDRDSQPSVGNESLNDTGAAATHRGPRWLRLVLAAPSRDQKAPIPEKLGGYVLGEVLGTVWMWVMVPPAPNR